MTTPGQTVGPFFHFALAVPPRPYAVPPETPGAITIYGRVFDGAGEPVPDALIETWQADPDGRFDHPDDPRGAVSSPIPGARWQTRCATDELGRYRIVTVKPGAVPGSKGGTQAPHLDVIVLGRGLLHRLVTRIYFPGDEAAHDLDQVLSSLPDQGRRHTLVARAEPDGLRFDIYLQGEHETVFFAV